MSGDVICKCSPRRLVVTMRNYNRSAFNGYHWTPSDYSQVRCLTCGHFYRTKAKYVDGLPDATEQERIGNVEDLPSINEIATDTV